MAANTSRAVRATVALTRTGYTGTVTLTRYGDGTVTFTDAAGVVRYAGSNNEWVHDLLSHVEAFPLAE